MSEQNPFPTDLDANQIFQKAFNQDTERIRVDAELSASIIPTPGLEVAINAVDDNIAIRNSTNSNELLINNDGSINVTATFSGTVGTVDQGNPNTLSNAWPVKITDGTDAVAVNADGSLNIGNFPSSFSVTQGTSPWITSFSSPQHIILDSGTISLPTGAATETTLADLDSKFSAAASLSDSFANPTTTQIGAFLSGWDSAGNHWDRIRSIGNDSDTIGTAANGQLKTISQLYGFNGTTWDRLRSSISNGLAVDVTRVTGNVTVVGTGTFAVQASQSGNWSTRTQDGSGNSITSTGNALDINLKTSSITLPVSGTVAVTQSTSPWVVTSNTTTTGGMTRFRNTAITNTAVSVKSSAGNLYAYHVYNSGSADAFLQFYNVASGSVSVGTTTPDLTYAIPAGGVLDGSFDSAPFSFATAITIAATSTATGGAAPGTALLVNLGYT